VGHAITATATSVASNETSEFSLAKTLLSPTAASVSLSGRVLDPQGRGISGASVIATNGSGALVRSRTNPFGYYTLPEVTAGESVVITVADKRFAFAPRLITGSDDLAGVDFIGARLE
jgi:hypothetical protein